MTSISLKKELINNTLQFTSYFLFERKGYIGSILVLVIFIKCFDRLASHFRFHIQLQKLYCGYAK